MRIPGRLLPNIREAYENALIEWMIRIRAINTIGGNPFHFQQAYPEFVDYPRPEMYFDGRMIQSDPYYSGLTVALILDEVAKIGESFGKIAGVANGAVPVAVKAGDKLKIGHIYVLKEAKKYGTGKQIEGLFSQGEHVLTYEDVFSTGDSTVGHMKKCAAAGLCARTAISFLNYNIGSEYQFGEEKIYTSSLFTVQRLMDVIVRIGKVTDKRAMEIVDYFETLRPLIEPVIAKKRADEAATQVASKKMFDYL